MRADAWIVDYLIRRGATDVFGIPGVVVMDLLYAIDRRKPEIVPHLTFHEQGAAFAACGFAQVSGKLGVAYATRGPGMTNLITGIAEAYYDSVPVIFFTAHSSGEVNKNMRVMNNQEIDTVSLVSNITKRAVRIDNLELLQKEVVRCCQLATSGRRGPVFLDILSGLFSQEVADIDETEDAFISDYQEITKAVSDISERIRQAKRPVILIGNGARYGESPRMIREISAKFGIPILSSRSAQDILPDSSEYFGFVGSRATRYSNFILSKSDLIIALGNRLAFPICSKSFRPTIEHAVTIRIDADETEFYRHIPNSKNYCVSVEDLLPVLCKEELRYEFSEDWLAICKTLKSTLWKWDKISVISHIMKIIESSNPESALVCDVGNHSFWVTTAYSYAEKSNRILYSGSFGALGSALPKAIGAIYSTKRPAVCFVGDQGFQMNIQELQFISQNRLPITIVILNNNSSGMIMEREKVRFGNHLVHTTTDSGYSYPNFESIAKAYNLSYQCIDAMSEPEYESIETGKVPLILELIVDECTRLEPSLPQGNACQDLAPELPRELYNRLNAM